MDATNDAIIAIVHDYNWWNLKNFALSLSKSGFKGRKVLFVNNVTPVARQELVKLGFELIDYQRKKKFIVIERFALLHDWLKANPCRFVITTDVKDVVIQRDPSPWMEAESVARPSVKIWGASEFILYSQEKCNPQWVFSAAGQAGMNIVRNEEVICAGTIAGEWQAMTELSQAIYSRCADEFGPDQAWLNILLRTDYKDLSRIPTWDEGFILTAGWWLIGHVNGNPDQSIGKNSHLNLHPPVLRNGVAYPCGSDTPYCIVHQYDRGNAWAPEIDKAYPSSIIDGENPQERLTWKKVNSKMKYGADGMTVDWFSQYART